MTIAKPRREGGRVIEWQTVKTIQAICEIVKKMLTPFGQGTHPFTMETILTSLVNKVTAVGEDASLVRFQKGEPFTTRIITAESQALVSTLCL